MSLLSQVLSNAKESVKATGRSISSGMQNQVEQEINRVVNTPRAAVQGALGAGAAGIMSAAQSAIRGDLGGAAEQLMSTPSQMLGQLMSPITSTVQSMGSILGSLGVQGGLGLPTMLATGMPNPAVPGNALAGLLARPDPLMSFLWYLDLPVIQVDGRSVGLPWYFTEEATVPFRTYEPRAVYRDGRNRNYAGKYNVDPLNIGVYLDDRGQALQYWQTWDSAIVAPFGRSDARTRGGGFRPPRMYQKDIQIYLLDFSKRRVIRFTCIECWPQNIDGLALQSQTNDRLVGRITLNVGDVFTEIFSLGDSRWPLDRVNIGDGQSSIQTSAIPNPSVSYSLNRGVPVPTPATIGQQAQAFPVEV